VGGTSRLNGKLRRKKGGVWVDVGVEESAGRRTRAQYRECNAGEGTLQVKISSHNIDVENTSTESNRTMSAKR